MLPFPIKICPVEIFTRAWPGSSLVLVWGFLDDMYFLHFYRVIPFKTCAKGLGVGLLLFRNKLRHQLRRNLVLGLNPSRACTRTVLEKWRGYLQCPIKSNESSCPADTCWAVYYNWVMVDSHLSPSGLTTQSHRFLTSSDKVDQRLVVLRHPVIRPGMELEVRVRSVHARNFETLNGWFS